MSQAQRDAIVQKLREAGFGPNMREADVRAGMDAAGELFKSPEDVALEEVELGGRPAERMSANEAGPTVLYFHGGGYVAGSPQSHRHLCGYLAKACEGVVYSLDYRLAPEHPFPAATEDTFAAYAALLQREETGPVILAGDSAGGGLVFATAIAVREAGLPAPAGLLGISPWVSLTTDNESYDKLRAADPILSREMVTWYSSRYLGGHDPRDPRASPLFADHAGLPPTLIQIGDHECFFGDAVSLHQSLIEAGVSTKLSVGHGLFHVWHFYWPYLSEAKQALDEAGAFIRECCNPTQTHKED